MRAMSKVLKFRKKPVVIEAVKAADLLQDARNNFWAMPKWIISAYDKGDIIFASHQVLIQTLEGRMTGEESDWIIQGVKGEIYPCKPDIFESTYEAVDYLQPPTVSDEPRAVIDAKLEAQ
jgi:hypothetical protein